MSEEELRAEIQQLEDEIEMLERGESDVDIVALVREQFENVEDDLLVDIINADTNTESNTITNTNAQDRETFTENIINRVLEENVHRFNGITLFPVSADSRGSYLGIRFDTFNTVSKRFNKPHYIILNRRESSGKGNTSEEIWKWSVFQNTLPPSINIGKYEQEYLFEEHNSWSDNTVIPGLNMVNKFAMRVYDELHV